MALNCNEPEKPSIIWARDFNEPVGRFPLRAHGQTVRLWAEAFGSEAKMGEFAGLVHGVTVEQGSRVQHSDGLLAPTAVFRGLKRPLHNLTSSADQLVYIYITNPPWTFKLSRQRRHEDAPLERLPPPITSVFATYVTFEQDQIDAEFVDVAQREQPVGLVVGWEWLEASNRTPNLPYDYDFRFDARVY